MRAKEEFGINVSNEKEFCDKERKFFVAISDIGAIKFFKQIL